MASPIPRLALSERSCGPLVAAWSQPDRGQVVAAIKLRSGPVTVAAGGGGPSREEAVMRMVMQAMGRREFLDEVTEYEPGRRIAHRSVGGRADGDPHGLPG